MRRYRQILDVVDEIRPGVICEVGTHLGARAQLMCSAALKYGPVHYIGFDVFETESEGFHAAAMNGKGVASRKVAEQCLRRLPGLTFELVEGDTRVTLHGRKIKADLVFIDGDHRAEVIRGDFESFDARCIVFDDYLSGDVDTSEIGANAVCDELGATLLPIKDCTALGFFTQLAVLKC